MLLPLHVTVVIDLKR